MIFIDYIKALESNLGYHHVPLNMQAETLQDLFDGTSVQSEIIIKLVRAIYKDNRCASLDSEISRSVTEDCLASIRLAALQSRKTDIDTYHFLEDLCLTTDKIFADSGDSIAKPSQHKNKSRAKGKEDKSPRSNIVSIEHKRHLRWLKSSA